MGGDNISRDRDFDRRDGALLETIYIGCQVAKI